MFGCTCSYCQDFARWLQLLDVRAELLFHAYGAWATRTTEIRDERRRRS